MMEGSGYETLMTAIYSWLWPFRTGTVVMGIASNLTGYLPVINWLRRHIPGQSCERGGAGGRVCRWASLLSQPHQGTTRPCTTHPCSFFRTIRPCSFFRTTSPCTVRFFPSMLTCTVRYRTQCCWSETFIPDPGSEFSYPGSRVKKIPECGFRFSHPDPRFRIRIKKLKYF